MPGSVLREAKWGALRTQLDMSAKCAQDKHQEGDGGKGKTEPPALEWVKVESDLGTLPHFCLYLHNFMSVIPP